MQTSICGKNVTHIVHEFGIIVNNMNEKQVRNKKKFLGKLETIFQFLIKEYTAGTLLCIYKLDRNNIII